LPEGAADKNMVPQDDLEQAFDRMWQEIRGAPSGSATSNLYSGQPRTKASSQGVLLAQEALQLADKSGRDRFLIEAWKMLAYALNADERYEEALPHYQRVIEKLEAAGEHAQAARQKIGYVGALFKSGRYQEALDIADTAENWFLRYNDDFGVARLWTNIGNLYWRNDDPRQAYRYHLMAAQTFEKIGDQRALAMAYMNLGNVLADFDSFEKADELYEKCENVSNSIGMVDLCAQAQYNRAWLHFLRGRYSDALQSFSRLRQRFEQSGSHRHYGLCDLDEAEIYIHLNLSKDAATLATRAAEQFEAIGLKYEQAKATTFYGISLIQMRRYSEALDAFYAAQTIFDAEGNSYWLGLLDLYRAEVQFSLQRFWEAQSLAIQAKTSFENLSIPSKRMFSLVLLGRVSLALNDLVAAEATMKEISALTEVTKVPLVLFPYHVLCAEIAERSRKWDDAITHYERAAEELERHQARLHHDDLRVTFFKGRQQAYDALVRLSLDRMEENTGLATAYAWCERARSRGLVELLSHYAPSGHGHAEPSLLTKVNRLREELNTHYARSTPEVSPIPSASNFETIAFKEQELARTLREVSEADPEYVSLQQVSIATIDSVKAALPERTTLVEYFTIGDEVLAFVISRNDARVFRRLCPATRIISLQERLRFQFEKFMLGPEYLNIHSAQILESTRRHLHDLYRNLLAPFITQIKTPHVTIVPHGTLHFLPFHAFYDGEKYLIDDYEVSYAPSASVFKYCLEKQPVAEQAPLLVGVADENIPLIGSEISALKALFPDSRVLLDDAATRMAFVESSRESSFVHIATHAVFRQDNPMFSSFKLADGWFTALDLFSMTCKTNLVTLSGCQSGMGEVTGSDDLLGLMRGFLYAGARSLLVSLWNVNDESTAALMEGFYREWGKSSYKSTALRAAMLSVRKSYPSPFYWAPFLLVGNP
jgi:CHAT domain-containing protein